LWTYPCSAAEWRGAAGGIWWGESGRLVFSGHGSAEVPCPWPFGVPFRRFRSSRRLTNLRKVAAPAFRGGKYDYSACRPNVLHLRQRQFNKHFNATRRTFCSVVFSMGVLGVKIGLGRSMLIINARLAAIRFYLRLANWLINKMSAMPWENFR